MSIWDDIAKSASDAASFAVRKTGEFTSLAKMKLALHTEETKLSDLKDFRLHASRIRADHLRFRIC